MNRNKRGKVWPTIDSSHDGGAFDETDVGNFGVEGDDSALFQSNLPAGDLKGWDVNDNDVFSAVNFDKADRSPKNAEKRKGGRGKKNLLEGGRNSNNAPQAGVVGKGNVRYDDNDDVNYDDDDDDDAEVVFGQDGLSVDRERLAEKVRLEEARMEKLTKQIRTLMERVYEFRKLAAKAKSEAVAQEKENLELKARLEQMWEDQNDLMMAQARSGLTRGVNRANARDANNTRDLDAEMRKRRLAKNALLAGVETEDEEDLVITLEGITTSILAQLTGRFYRWMGKKLPLGADVRAIQARYGSAVASYFHFYRWLVGSYLVLASPTVVWIIYHISGQKRGAVLRGGLVGIIPSFLAYSSFDTGAQNVYATMVVLTIAVQVISAMVKWIREDKIRKELYIVDEEQKHVQFAKAFLVGWDNSLSNEQEAEDLRLSNGLAAANMLAEIFHADAFATRSLEDRILLYGHRCYGLALYIGVQMAAWAAIIVLTAQSDKLTKGLAKQLQSVAWLTQAAATISTSIVPAAVTIINAIMPMIIKAITKLEKWDMERTVTYMLTSRMFLAKILNAFIQALSYLLLANPYFFANDKYSEVRSRVEQTFEPAGYSCRMDQAGAGLFQLVVTEFVFSKIINYATLRATQVKAKWSKKVFVKPEFEVAKRMVSLLYFQALILAAYPFFPMGTVFTAPFLILSFKFEKHLLTTFQSKPKGRLKAQDGYSFFIKFYLFTLVLLGVMATLFLIGSTNFAKTCSIQDNQAGLCATNTIDPDSSVCSPLDSTNIYYAYFTEECAEEGYPACICKDKLACGPFVDVTSGYQTLNKKLRSFSLIGYVYGYLADHIIVVWCVAIMLWLTILFQRNSAQTQADAAADREREWMNEAQATQARLKKQTKLIEKMQLQAGALLMDELN